MNVLLTQANVPYDRMNDLDEINDAFAKVDVAVVIGINDVVNPAAQNRPHVFRLRQAHFARE